jgi:hypothetical protein
MITYAAMEPRAITMRMLWVNASLTAMTYWVRTGRSSGEPRSLKMFLNEGMTKPRRTHKTPPKMTTTDDG